jgi:Xaa-Pro aminopeptidase
MEVHDVGSFMKPFEPGVVITVEPGVYETSSGIGIRIEDVVLVTADGCEVLSAGAPKDRKTIEELIASDGILDREKPTAAPAGSGTKR